MVRVAYNELEMHYSNIKANASGRSSCSVMLLVGYDVDACAATRVLCQLMRTDNISYTMFPVANMTQLRQRYSDRTDDTRTIILVNCGAVLNIPQEFDLEHGDSGITCYIFDNHRPFHLSNIHATDSVVCFDDQNHIQHDIEYNIIPSEEVYQMELMRDSDIYSSDEESGSELESEVESESEGEYGSEDDAEADLDGAEAEDEVEVETEEQDEGEGVEGEPDAESDAGSDGEVDASKTEAEDAVDDESEPEAEEEDGENSREIDEIDEKEEEEEDEEEEEHVVKGKKRNAWAMKHDPERIEREKLKAYYSRGFYYDAPTSIYLLWLVQSVYVNGRVPVDIYWQMMLGVTEQYLISHIKEDAYLELANHLNAQIKDTANVNKRFKQGEGENMIEINSTSKDLIEPSNEYRFYLYRHWTLYESMKFSNYISSKLNVWNSQTNTALESLLVNVGVPKSAYMQEYNYMDVEARERFENNIKLGEISNRFNLKAPVILLPSFLRYNTFSNAVSAIDAALAASALLEVCRSSSIDENIENQSNPNAAGTATGTGVVSVKVKGKSPVVAFNEAYDCISMKNNELLNHGLQTAIGLQKAIVMKANAMLEKRSSSSDAGGGITSTRKMRFALIHESPVYAAHNNVSATVTATAVDTLFARPNVLFRLGLYLMEVQKANGRWKKDLPLILVCEKTHEGVFLVLGISPSALQTYSDKIDMAVEAERLTIEEADADGEEGEEEESLIKKDLKRKQPDTHTNTSSSINTNSNTVNASIRGYENFNELFKMAANRCSASFRNDFFNPDMIEIDHDFVDDFLAELDHLLRKIQ